ncbi:hypothetical protein [Stenotrophomonas hibiscicola]|uniref:hypothetical protein n=1 Tax=Stenotrophomonas hibiscicola TaxID=86189 RepID=UPI002E7A0734|nr:hypothetical protein [[Pseudomonas] hibiscicola]
MSILDYSKEIASILVGLFGLIGKLAAKPKTSMGWGPRASISHILPPFTDADGNVTDQRPHLTVGSFFISNTGKVPLSEIEIVLNYSPQSLNLWPPRPFSITEIAHGRIAISLPTLSPKDELWFEMVAVNNTLPNVLSVRSKETVARPITVDLLPVAPRWQIRAIQILSLFGVVAAVYATLWLLSGLLTDNWSWLNGGCRGV